MLRLHMVAYHALPWLVALCGCSTYTFSYGDPDAYKTVNGSPTQQALADATLENMAQRIDVDAARITVTFVTTDEEQSSACGGYAACAKPQVNGYLINTYWPEEGWDAIHAYLLAHELCHIYYYQTGEGGDPEHTHGECFGWPGAYGNVDGHAWLTAIDIEEEYGD